MSNEDMVKLLLQPPDYPQPSKGWTREQRVLVESAMVGCMASFRRKQSVTPATLAPNKPGEELDVEITIMPDYCAETQEKAHRFMKEKIQERGYIVFCHECYFTEGWEHVGKDPKDNPAKRNSIVVHLMAKDFQVMYSNEVAEGKLKGWTLVMDTRDPDIGIHCIVLDLPKPDKPDNTDEQSFTA